MRYKMGNKVYIKSSKKLDGRFNRGKIVGVELSYHALGFLTEAQYLNDFEHPKYKVAYVDVFTGRAYASWYEEDDLCKDKPE
jgi:hypothetical protein